MKVGQRKKNLRTALCIICYLAIVGLFVTMECAIENAYEEEVTYNKEAFLKEKIGYYMNRSNIFLWEEVDTAVSAESVFRGNWLADGEIVSCVIKNNWEVSLYPLGTNEKVRLPEHWLSRLPFNTYEKDGMVEIVQNLFNSEDPIEITYKKAKAAIKSGNSAKKDVTFELVFQDGEFPANLEMEELLGISTEQIVEDVEKNRQEILELLDKVDKKYMQNQELLYHKRQRRLRDFGIWFLFVIPGVILGTDILVRRNIQKKRM